MELLFKVDTRILLRQCNLGDRSNVNVGSTITLTPVKPCGHSELLVSFRSPNKPSEGVRLAAHSHRSNESLVRKVGGLRQHLGSAQQ